MKLVLQAGEKLLALASKWENRTKTGESLKN
jgi:hypothetical protein